MGWYGELLDRDADLGGLDDFRLSTAHKPPSYDVGALLDRVIADMTKRDAK